MLVETKIVIAKFQAPNDGRGGRSTETQAFYVKQVRWDYEPED